MEKEKQLLWPPPGPASASPCEAPEAIEDEAGLFDVTSMDDAAHAEMPQDVPEDPIDDFPQSLQFMAAARRGDLYALQTWVEETGSLLVMITDQCDEFGLSRSALHYAAAGFHRDCVKFLLDEGAPIDTPDSRSWTPLHHCLQASAAAQPQSLQRARGLTGGQPEAERMTEMAHLLLDRQAKATSRTADGLTCLHMACACGLTEVARRLLNLGADLHEVDSHRQTALHFAVCSGARDLVQLLLQQGASAVAQDEAGCNSVHLAANRGSLPIVQTLLQDEDAYVDIDRQDNDGNTPLHCAFHARELEVVHLLVQAGANTMVRNSLGQSPLSLAIILEPRLAEQVLDGQVLVSPLASHPHLEEVAYDCSGLDEFPQEHPHVRPFEPVPLADLARSSLQGMLRSALQHGTRAAHCFGCMLIGNELPALASEELAPGAYVAQLEAKQMRDACQTPLEAIIGSSSHLVTHPVVQFLLQQKWQTMAAPVFARELAMQAAPWPLWCLLAALPAAGSFLFQLALAGLACVTLRRQLHLSARGKVAQARRAQSMSKGTSATAKEATGETFSLVCWELVSAATVQSVVTLVVVALHWITYWTPWGSWAEGCSRSTEGAAMRGACAFPLEGEEQGLGGVFSGVPLEGTLAMGMVLLAWARLLRFAALHKHMGFGLQFMRQIAPTALSGLLLYTGVAAAAAHAQQTGCSPSPQPAPASPLCVLAGGAAQAVQLLAGGSVMAWLVAYASASYPQLSARATRDYHLNWAKEVLSAEEQCGARRRQAAGNAAVAKGMVPMLRSVTEGSKESDGAKLLELSTQLKALQDSVDASQMQCASDKTNTSYTPSPGMPSPQGVLTGLSPMPPCIPSTPGSVVGSGEACSKHFGRIEA
ncbi:hypothetical protein CYMTET_23436 [Cymbomonas tetramitiformis]|uniref:Uncharacterized protein n=1 Tax=Cymbomonas tetramitiformis TaxID=36881 RepID=A0AAE0L137_9CHLO|nr:hypothetical protein CYMTET_23436 [Cymbomonas tetramitiformis]